MNINLDDQTRMDLTKETISSIEEKMRNAMSIFNNQNDNAKKLIEAYKSIEYPKSSYPQVQYIPYESPVVASMNRIETMFGSLVQHLDLSNLEAHGFSDSARTLFEIVKEKPRNPNEFVRIKMTDYSSLYSDAHFEYGLSQLKVSGIISEYESFQNGDFLVCFTERGVGLIGTLNPLGSKKSQLDASALLVMSYYPLFEKHFHLLETYQYLTVDNGKLVWLKSKICLAEYFASFGVGTKWSLIEKAFNSTNLKASYNNATNQSSDFKKLKEIINLP